MNHATPRIGIRAPVGKRLLGAALAWLSLAAASPARAADAPSPRDADRAQQRATVHTSRSTLLADGERSRRLRLLHRRAQEWQRVQERLVRTCHQCDGRGRLRQPHYHRDSEAKGMGSAFVACPACHGTRKHISRRAFMKAYYAMRSPAFRAQPERLDEVRALRDEVQSGQLELRTLARHVYAQGELLDPEHGIAWFTSRKSEARVPTRWVWAADAGRRANWFVHEASADGSWPQSLQAPRVAREDGTQRPTWRPLPQREHETVARLLAPLGVVIQRFELLVRGEDLLLREIAAQRPIRRADVRQIPIHALLIARSLHAAKLGYASVRSQWRLPMKDEQGRVSMRVALTAGLSREAYLRGNWAALSPSEQLGRMVFKRQEHPGYELVLTD